MPRKPDYYEFAGLRFTPSRLRLENLHNGKKIFMSLKHQQFLLALLEKPGEVVTYDELRKAAWSNEIELSDGLQHNIQTTKGNLVKWLGDNGIKANFIEVVPKHGYRLSAEVVAGFESSEEGVAASLSEEQNPLPENEAIKNVSDDNFSRSGIKKELSDKTIPQQTLTNKFSESFWQTGAKHAVFIIAGSFCYGLLFWLALLLEISYRFDVYGLRALWLGLPLVVLIAALTAFGLILTGERARNGKRGALVIGLAVFTGTAVLTCLALSRFLPQEAVTLARFQAQPAFAAFVKNALLYILPLGIFFLLIPFYAVAKAENKAAKSETNPIYLRPVWLFLLLVGGLLYALPATFYLFDNLKPGAYHALFVVLGLLRLTICFSFGAACVWWYKNALNRTHQKPTDAALFQFNHKRKFVFTFSLLACFVLIWDLAQAQLIAPHLETVEIITSPAHGRQFFINLRGTNFEPGTIEVCVIGAGCPDISPCIVPNSALHKHGSLSPNIMENIPLTLATGDFQILAQNGDSPPSNFLAFNIPNQP